MKTVNRSRSDSVYEPKDFEKFLGIPTEQFRNWRTHLDPYAPYLTHDERKDGPIKRGERLRAEYDGGGALAFKIIKDLLEEQSVPFSNMANDLDLTVIYDYCDKYVDYKDYDNREIFIDTKRNSIEIVSFDRSDELYSKCRRAGRSSSIHRLSLKQSFLEFQNLFTAHDRLIKEDGDHAQKSAKGNVVPFKNGKN